MRIVFFHFLVLANIRCMLLILVHILKSFRHFLGILNGKYYFLRLRFPFLQ
ncbi:unnamed protein product [Meloidogyne enterolobii]|uniref:Uncharacterized protein n=1 Tax=Meloidogyne enterolobii TaxID=390850 RepID=A0ACB1B2Y1_MELEN